MAIILGFLSFSSFSTGSIHYQLPFHDDTNGGVAQERHSVMGRVANFLLCRARWTSEGD